MDRLFELLKRFSEAPGISGYEDGVREVLRRELEGLVDEIREDTLGNLIGVKRGERPSIMLAAHMDEIGLMVKHIDEDGFIKFVKIGGWFDQTLLDQRVLLLTENGPVYGVIGSKPPHVMSEEERKKPVKAEDMFIDIGASSREEVEKAGVRIGTPVVLERSCVRLIGDRVCGKAFDDRAGIVAMIEAIRRAETGSQIYAVATVQEEVGLKGARTSAYALEPDVAIVLETCIATDSPGFREKKSIKLGGGPAITVVDASGRGIITHQKVLRWMRETAEEFGIPFQLEVSDGGTTDATAIHLTKSGILAGVISVPTRYIHTSVSILSLGDLENCIELTRRCIETAPKFFKP
ncbi:MAG: M42 family metallopeptidase [Archaeoglobi archaeon]|nr:M42 family metallopeptidase [Candidatus Mnemosynella bozhongmuii]